ncbi:MAG: hypothetical protein ABSD71_02270 [Bacteroidales bacterium]|jgi:hypothetical protein
MRKLSIIFLLFLTSILIVPGCKKASINYTPVTLTDKSGNIFIQIDTASKSFDGYTANKLGKGQISGVFNDSVRSSFYLALTTRPYWDTIYHAPDTTIFPTHYVGPTLHVATSIDLTNYTSPYHFLLLGLDTRGLDVGTLPKLSIVVTFTPGN